jgi:protein gp37
MSKRLAGRFGYPADDPFAVTLHPDKLDQPLRWRKPRTVFVCSMGDLFHEDVPDKIIHSVFDVIRRSPRHTFCMLTKCPARMKMIVSEYRYHRSIWHMSPDLPRWLWLGVTAENQQRADERIPILLQIPAAVRFVSVEPMLGPINLFGFGSPTWGMIPPGAFLNWVICGAETGPGARPMSLDWAQSLRDQCQTASVPLFFKKDSSGSRQLDGQEWNQWPIN